MATVLILTPVKNATAYIDGYFDRLERLTYNKQLLSVAMLESDSIDKTYSQITLRSAPMDRTFNSFEFFKRDYKFNIPDGIERWAPGFQMARRTILARCRNQLLFRALRDHEWVLWLDVDVVGYPTDLIEQLLAHDRDILHPNCVREPGGKSFDLNAWKDDGKLLMHDLKGTYKPVRIDSVGGTALLVRADLHRDGLIFPAYRYGVQSPVIRKRHPVWGQGEIETEGLAAMAHDMGLQCWGLPDMELIHA